MTGPTSAERVAEVLAEHVPCPNGYSAHGKTRYWWTCDAPYCDWVSEELPKRDDEALKTAHCAHVAQALVAAGLVLGDEATVTEEWAVRSTLPTGEHTGRARETRVEAEASAERLHRVNGLEGRIVHRTKHVTPWLPVQGVADPSLRTIARERGIAPVGTDLDTETGKRADDE